MITSIQLKVSELFFSSGTIKFLLSENASVSVNLLRKPLLRWGLSVFCNAGNAIELLLYPLHSLHNIFDLTDFFLYVQSEIVGFR